MPYLAAAAEPHIEKITGQLVMTDLKRDDPAVVQLENSPLSA
jgi:hypothetical protein